MHEEAVDYNKIVDEQARKAMKNDNIRRKSLIAKDKQYFDSTELSKILNTKNGHAKTNGHN